MQKPGAAHMNVSQHHQHRRQPTQQQQQHESRRQQHHHHQQQQQQHHHQQQQPQPQPQLQQQQLAVPKSSTANIRTNGTASSSLVKHSIKSTQKLARNRPSPISTDRAHLPLAAKVGSASAALDTYRALLVSSRIAASATDAQLML